MYKKKKILVIVPARSGSKGIKFKNIKKINGVPLIIYTLEVVKKIKMIDYCLVSTDSKKILKITEDFGFKVPFLRPKYLSGDLVSDIDVIKSTLEKIEKVNNVKYDIILLLQPTSPLRKVNDIVMAVKKLVNEKFDSVWSLSLSDKKNHPLKQLKIEGKNIRYFDIKGEKIIARQQLSNLYQRNGIVYALTRDCVIKNKNLMGSNPGYILIDRISLNIDTKFDLEFAEFLLKKNEIHYKKSK